MSNSGFAARLSPDDRREQIIDVATRHLSRSSYESMSIQAVAKEAGVTRALVHHYFGGKESLLAAVIQRELDLLLESTKPDPALPARISLDRSLNAYLDHFSRSSGELRTFYSSVNASSPGADSPIQRNHEVQVQRLISVLELTDTPTVQVALGAWLAFVVEAAKQSATHPTLPRAELMRLCLDALTAVTCDSPVLSPNH